ncbi:unnamed protein product, partial [Ectocarpus fasciculatus]
MVNQEKAVLFIITPPPTDPLPGPSRSWIKRPMHLGKNTKSESPVRKSVTIQRASTWSMENQPSQCLEGRAILPLPNNTGRPALHHPPLSPLATTTSEQILKQVVHGLIPRCPPPASGPSSPNPPRRGRRRRR